jgi:transcriptional regulator with XRE-family HTH domain
VSASLASRIDRLFRSRLDNGREYSYRDVATAISNGQGRGRGETISSAYVWGLRTGSKDNPTMKHLQALARFFSVSPAYFFDEELTELPEEARLLAATSRESVRRLAVAALELSEESLAVVFGVVTHLRRLEGLPAQSTSMPDMLSTHERHPSSDEAAALPVSSSGRRA